MLLQLNNSDSTLLRSAYNQSAITRMPDPDDPEPDGSNGGSSEPPPSGGSSGGTEE